MTAWIFTSYAAFMKDKFNKIIEFVKLECQDFIDEFKLNFIDGDRWEWLLDGFKNTLLITLLAGLIGIVLGVVIAIVIELIGIPVLPFAIGVYLPVHLNACIMVGGIVRLILDKKRMADEKKKTAMVNDGILFCSGMIAGEGLVGIALAVLAIFGLDKVVDISGILNLSPLVSSIGGLVVFGLVILSLLKFSVWKKRA